MQRDLHLRPASSSDRAAVERLVFGVLAEYGLSPDPDGTDSDLQDIDKTYLQAGGSFDVLVTETGEVVGSVGLLPIAPGICELRKMYLAKAARGHGWGRQLLEHALSRARELGFTRVDLETATVLREAIQMYEKYGFRRHSPPHMSKRCDAAYFLELSR